LLWREPVKSSIGRHVTTPVIVGDLVLVASHQAGLIGIQVTQEGSSYRAERVWTAKESAINFSSPVAVGPYVYGLGPARNLICVEARTGQQAWSQEGYFTSSPGQAYASFLVLGKNLLVLGDNGQLHLIAAEPKGFRELASAQVCGRNWCNPAYADGRLFLRDGQELRCVQLVE